MKNLLVLVFMFAIVNISVAQIFTPEDGNSRGSVNSNFGAAQQAPNKYLTLAEAEQAPYTTGVNYYEPSFLTGRSRNPVDGVTKIRVPLEEDAIVQMSVVGGKYWVWLRKGTLVRFYVNAAGMPAESPYAHDACGNPIYAIKYMPSAQPQPMSMEQEYVGQQIEVQQTQSVSVNATPVYTQSNVRSLQIPSTYQMETRQFNQNPPCNPCNEEQLNYYSKANAQVLPPTAFNYQQAQLPQQMPYEYQPKVRNGMPKAVKWVVGIAAGAATYYLVSTVAKNQKANRPTTNEDGTDNGGQVVTTLPATVTGFAQPRIGVGFTIGF